MRKKKNRKRPASKDLVRVVGLGEEGNGHKCKGPDVTSGAEEGTRTKKCHTGSCVRRTRHLENADLLQKTLSGGLRRGHRHQGSGLGGGEHNTRGTVARKKKNGAPEKSCVGRRCEGPTKVNRERES